jgi:hypothetical protein
MRPELQAFLTRIKSGLYRVRDLSGLSRWIAENTSHPKHLTDNWSYDGHEFQEDILNDAAPIVDVKKCAQIGLSEVSARMALAMCAIFTGFVVIYSLPTSSFARKFAKQRFDPIVDNSKVLRMAIDKDTDSSELKQIGSSFLYIAGSFGQSSAISVPADCVINDEVDFSNQVALSTFSSRLEHDRDKKYLRRFSTPTVDGYGISKAYSTSSQARYAVFHDKCNRWVIPNILEDIIVPGHDADLLKLEKEDLPRIDMSKLWLRCSHCGQAITAENLADPKKRQWVHAFPDVRKDHSGYQVHPFDAPKVNSLRNIIQAIDTYKRKADWANFKLGVTFEDAENSVLMSVFERNSQLPWIAPRELAATGTVIGVDLGKTSWLIVGKRVSPTKMHVIHYERIRASGDDALVQTILNRCQQYRARMVVIDAMPDFSTALRVTSKRPVNTAFGCYYVKRDKQAMTNVHVDEANGTVKAFRSGTLSDMVKNINNSAIEFAKNSEWETLKAHLSHIKKITEDPDEAENEPEERWESTGEDHFAHALNYMMIADSLVTYEFKNSVPLVLPQVHKIKLNGAQDDDLGLLAGR